MSKGAIAARTPCRSAPLGAAAPAAAPKQPWSTRWRLHGEGAAAGQGLPSSASVERRLPVRAEGPINLRKAFSQGIHPLGQPANHGGAEEGQLCGQAPALTTCAGVLANQHAQA